MWFEELRTASPEVAGILQYKYLVPGPVTLGNASHPWRLAERNAMACKGHHLAGFMSVA